MIKLTGISAQVRQIAVKNIGRDEPTLIITNDLTTPGKNLFARYAERMMVENELDAYIGGFHLDALTSGVPLNVDLDTTLTVVAGNLYRLLALKLSRYEHATPETLWRDFLDATGTLHITHDRRHLRAEPAQPPPRPHRRRIRRPPNPDPLVGRPHPAVPVPATVTTRPQETSTQLSDRESRLICIPALCSAVPGDGARRGVICIRLHAAGTAVRPARLLRVRWRVTGLCR